MDIYNILKLEERKCVKSLHKMCVIELLTENNSSFTHIGIYMYTYTYRHVHICICVHAYIYIVFCFHF